MSKRISERIYSGCYHPMLAVPSGVTSSGKVKYRFLCRFDKTDVANAKIIDPRSVVVPCGKCIGCRLQKSRQWADRMMLELACSEKAIFLTLTYNNEHCPPASFDDDDNVLTYTLDKRDCQLFLKRLRDFFSDRKIRFFLSGEYGPQTQRPHYHAIIFGLGLDDFPDKVEKGRNELDQVWYKSDTMERIWKNGFALFSDVSWKTCAYVARYVQKKLYGEPALQYAIRNCTPEFSLMSRKPGIGAAYLKQHPDCLDYASIVLSDSDGSLKIPLPKYYLEKMNDEKSVLYDPEKYAIMKKQRMELADDAMTIRLMQTNLSLLDFLEGQEKKKLDAAKKLKRGDL